MKKCQIINDEYIKSFMLENEEIFIQIIDALWFRSYAQAAIVQNIQCYQERTDNVISSMMVVKNNQVYLRISEDLIPAAAKILNSMGSFFSLYGERKILTRLIPMLQLKQRSHTDYYVMRIDLQECAFSRMDCDGFYCIPADSSHFNVLKKLQHLYNLEEVYKGDLFYPYKSEMRAFKEKLRIRKNFAVFTKERHTKAVSKIYTNAESHDAYQIGGVYTLKKFRKKGLSYFCLVHLLEHAAGQKKRYVYLFVNKSNIPAINLYKKAGFTIVTESQIAYF